MARPVIMSSIIGVMVGIIPGTGASEASWFSYNTAKNLSRHPEEFGHGSVEGIAAAESANNAVTGANSDPPAHPGHPRRWHGGHHAFRLDDQRPEPRPFSVHYRRRYHVCHHAGTHPGQPLYAAPGQVPYHPVCQSGLHPPGDSYPHHCDLLLCRRLLRQRKLL